VSGSLEIPTVVIFTLADWRTILSEKELAVYEKAGYGAKTQPGKKPALVIIDVTTAFVGDRPEPIMESIRRFPSSCGERGWEAVSRIKVLLSEARNAKIPIIYSASDSDDKYGMTKWAEKFSRNMEEANLEYSSTAYIHPDIAPNDRDIVVKKSKPSIFFGTSLLSTLISLSIDTLLITGCTTSGCVRASVIDAFSYNFKALVVEECTFDRSETPHLINLFDMNQKYADVITLTDALEYLQTLQPQK
jgi:maleamate amidohydrolase